MITVQTNQGTVLVKDNGVLIAKADCNGLRIKKGSRKINSVKKHLIKHKLIES